MSTAKEEHQQRRLQGIEDARREAGIARDLAHEADLAADEHGDPEASFGYAQRSQAHGIAAIATLLAAGEVSAFARVRQ